MNVYSSKLSVLISGFHAMEAMFTQTVRLYAANFMMHHFHAYSFSSLSSLTRPDWCFYSVNIRFFRSLVIFYSMPKLQ
jgi:hypothetical protein